MLYQFYWRPKKTAKHEQYAEWCNLEQRKEKTDKGLIENVLSIDGKGEDKAGDSVEKESKEQH